LITDYRSNLSADWTGQEDPQDSQTKKKAEEPKLTLFGVLNAIDGVSAPEGHILMMTTNHKDSLDDALLRPGRIDEDIEFNYACREQIRDLYKKIYRPIRKVAEDSFDQTLIAKLAEKFADQVPEYKLSPAQIQQYLLRLRFEPEKAVHGVTAWLAEQNVQKHSFEKVNLEERAGGLVTFASTSTLNETNDRGD